MAMDYITTAWSTHLCCQPTIYKSNGGLTYSCLKIILLDTRPPPPHVVRNWMMRTCNYESELRTLKRRVTPTRNVNETVFTGALVRAGICFILLLVTLVRPLHMMRVKQFTRIFPIRCTSQ